MRFSSDFRLEHAERRTEEFQLAMSRKIHLITASHRPDEFELKSSFIPLFYKEGQGRFWGEEIM